VQQAGERQRHVLRPGDEGQGSKAAPVLGLTRADWLLEDARVLTLDPRRPLARALAVGSGRVLALGSAAEVRPFAGPATERLDCRGATVLPGLIDPHLHLFGLAARAAHLDCAGPRIRTVDDLLAAVRAHAECLPPGAWVRGEGLDEGRLGRLPGAAELEAAAAGHPVRLRHRSRHASLLSSGALRLLGDGPGVERRDGVATGLVSGREQTLRRLVGPLPAETLARGLAAAAHDLVALGLSTIADATPRSRRALAPLRDAMAAGRCPLRVYAMRPRGSPAWRATGRLHPGPVKIMVEEETRGLRPGAATLARHIAAAAAAGDQIAVHCVGAATLVAALAAFAALPRPLRLGRRHRLEHVAECPPPLVPRIAELGLAVVTNPAFVHWRGDAYRAETEGAARAWLYRARSLAAAGIPLAGASDAPVVPPSPWIGIAAARARRTAAGHALGAAERLGAEAALRLFTSGAAFVLGADRLGRLVPGGPADLVVVEPDPLQAPPDEVATARVRLTLVEGQRAWPR
jgi:predicted amidohydrolase YtcJ